MKLKLPHKAWVVTVDMGYGHQRAAYPLNDLACGGVITANNYRGIPQKDKVIWHNSRRFYEFISRFKKVPVIGEKVFKLYDKFQSIPQFYPRRDLSRSNIQLKQIYGLMERTDWGRHLIEKLAEKPLPFISTFFITAMMAEFFKYPGEIYCIICDADFSRTWVPISPGTSRINFFASNKRVVERLKLYGVRASKIFFTGFPLPNENTGPGLRHAKHDLGRRLIQLDPKKIYINQYEKTLRSQLGKNNLKKTISRPLTITFAVGGAGAQRELGIKIVKSLRGHILAHRVRINLVAGIHPAVNQYFSKSLKGFGLCKNKENGVRIVFAPGDKEEYFKQFNKILRETDILWTKPSELSFYCALGIPIIMAPPIGSQEIFNQKWLESIGSGLDQEDPRYANEWLFDWIDSGWLAEAAMQGYMEAPKYGAFNIEKIIFHKYKEAKKVKTVLQY